MDDHSWKLWWSPIATWLSPIYLPPVYCLDWLMGVAFFVSLVRVNSTKHLHFSNMIWRQWNMCVVDFNLLWNDKWWWCFSPPDLAPSFMIFKIRMACVALSVDGQLSRSKTENLAFFVWSLPRIYLARARQRKNGVFSSLWGSLLFDYHCHCHIVHGKEKFPIPTYQRVWTLNYVRNIVT